MTDLQYDVIVVGGGPAGSTAAALLAEHGRRVLVLEKDRFPRYHVGESLMPYCWFTLDRLGVVEKMKAAGFPEKHSVQFVSRSGRVSAPFYFFQHYDHPSSTTWQVLRSEFDLMLLNNAREKGAHVREGIRVRELVYDGAAVVGVRAVDEEGRELEFGAPMTVDASGRDALAMARNRWRIPDQRLRKIAIWTYYRGARRDPGLDEGATTVAYLPEKGWFWFIPLPDDLASVGLVAERDYLFTDTRDAETVFDREVAKNDWIRQHVETGVRVNAPGMGKGPFYTTSEWSYRSRYSAADGLVLVGDAFGFLDPVFSSGIFIALKSGELAADVIHHGFETGDLSASRFVDYSRTLRQGLEAMRRLVYAFYDTDFSFRELMQRHPNIRGDLTDCLIGHLFRDFDDLFAAVTEFAELPAPVEHGDPLIASPCASST